MTLKLLGRLEQDLSIQEDFHRNYSIKWLVETDDTLDGPQRVITCPGLPVVGSSWNFGNDNEPLAYCWPNWTVSEFRSGDHEPNELWVVEQPYSTKFNLMQLNKIDNPLAAPPDISGTFVKYQEEQRFDYQGKIIQTLSFEPFRGKINEWDANRPTVSIGLNYAELGLNVFAFMIDNVNDSDMWGLGPRMVKLSNIRWTRQVWAFGYYYTRVYDFDVNFKTFDRIAPQEGRLELMVGGDPLNKKHWQVRKEVMGETLPDRFYYKANGTDWDPATEDETVIAKKKIQYYPQTNLFILGIPSSF